MRNPFVGRIVVFGLAGVEGDSGELGSDDGGVVGVFTVTFITAV